jgi:SPP1 family predicted phage head-tail adaptor
MPKCERIKKRHRQVCVGDLQDFGTVNTRVITPPQSGSVDFTETFTKKIDSFMLIETARGEQIFDEVDIQQDVTHKIYLPYIPTLTFQDWIEIEGQNFDIIDVEDLENRHEFQLCRCTNRGLNTKAATNA